MTGTSSSSEPVTERKLEEYTRTTDIVYGSGIITLNGTETIRDLWMDVYAPTEQATGPRPAVVVVFGGSFHRGGPRHTFSEDGVQDTAMGDYAAYLAQRGYVCFAIDYRLAPELPKSARSGYTADSLDMDSMKNPLLLQQVNKVRGKMGLAPLEERDDIVLQNTILTAAEDARQAIDFIRQSGDRFSIDPGKMAVGGFSAGAATSLNVAYGMHVPVSAVFMLSGGMGGFDSLSTLTASPGNPPLLMFQGQYDLDGVLRGTPLLLRHFRNVHLEHELAWVPGFGHFYPAGASTLAFDGSRMSVLERILQFLDKAIPVSD